MLRSLTLLRGLGWGDLMTALVSLAIVQANVAHLDAPGGEGQTFGDGDRASPNDRRRPVSVLAVSATLGLPYETTRRHVSRLIGMGVVERVKGGLIVPQARLQTEAQSDMMQANLSNLRRLYRALRAAGVELD